MNTQDLMGSFSKDLFKWWHKQISVPGARSWYASDGDLFLSNKIRPLCLQDYKQGNDDITFIENRVYKDLFMRGIPIYIIRDILRVTGNIIRFNKENLENHLYSLGISVNTVKDIMETSIEKPLKTDAMNTMEKDLSVWDYIPDNSEQGYSSKFISGNYIEWERELRERR